MSLVYEVRVTSSRVGAGAVPGVVSQRTQNMFENMMKHMFATCSKYAHIVVVSPKRT